MGSLFKYAQNASSSTWFDRFWWNLGEEILGQRFFRVFRNFWSEVILGSFGVTWQNHSQGLGLNKNDWLPTKDDSFWVRSVGREKVRLFCTVKGNERISKLQVGRIRRIKTTFLAFSSSRFVYFNYYRCFYASCKLLYNIDGIKNMFY